jgi:Kef-type K+ transport system membrane component KefB
MQTAFSASTEETLVHLLLQVAVILTAAKGLGAVFVRIGQSRSIGEILAGVMLGPSLFGWLAPDVAAAVCSPQGAPRSFRG